MSRPLTSTPAASNAVTVDVCPFHAASNNASTCDGALFDGSGFVASHSPGPISPSPHISASPPPTVLIHDVIAPPILDDPSRRLSPAVAVREKHATVTPM